MPAERQLGAAASADDFSRVGGLLDLRLVRVP